MVWIGRLNDLLPRTLQEALGDNYQWSHDVVQREHNQWLSERHDESFDDLLTRVPGHRQSRKSKGALRLTILTRQSCGSQKLNIKNSQLAAHVSG